jgi:hypothetical protein
MFDSRPPPMIAVVVEPLDDTHDKSNKKEEGVSLCLALLAAA